MPRDTSDQNPNSAQPDSEVQPGSKLFAGLHPFAQATAAWMESRSPAVHLLVITFLFLAPSLWLHIRYPLAHPEIEIYLPHHLSNGPLINKVFDENVLDLQGRYQNRELCHLVDNLDARFISMSVRAGFPHFLALSQYVFIILTILLIWHFFAKDLRLGTLSASLLVLLFCTSTHVFIIGYYFKSDRGGIPLIAASFIILLYRTISGPSPTRMYFRMVRGLAFFGLGLAATMFSRQGFFLLVTATIFLGLRTIVLRDVRCRLPLLACALATVVSVCNNRFITPWLVFWLNGYRPDFAFQNQYLHFLYHRPVGSLLNGMTLFLDSAGHTLGNLPGLFLAPVILLIVWLLAKETSRSASYQRPRFLPARTARVAIMIVLIVLLYAKDVVMYAAHPPIAWPDVRRGDYFLPDALLLIMFLALAINRVYENKLILKIPIQAALLVLLMGNVYSLTDNLMIEGGGHLKQVLRFTPSLIEGLRKIKTPNYQPPVEVKSTPIYQHFQQTMGLNGQ
jgi:hypothetical protein